MDKINIAFAVNDQYVDHLCITIYSILRNNPGVDFSFYVLCDSLTRKSKRKINRIKPHYSNAEIEVVELRDKGYGFDEFAIPDIVSFISKEMYFRYALPEVLGDIDKVLYLDADLIVLGDIRHLYNQNLSNYYIAGVADAGLTSRFPDHLPNLGMKNSDIYVNSGVLLMNLTRMRDNNITEKLIENTKSYEGRLLFPDQDVLNLTLKGYIKQVDCIFNFTDQNMVEDTVNIDKVRIVHFTGGIKPWHSVPQAHTAKYVNKYLQYEDEYYDLIRDEINPLISLIVPVHNINRNYLEVCFASIKEQTYKNIEVIVVDDGSNRATADFLDAYVKGLSGWRVIHQVNKGVNMARRAGFEESKGDFITFVDSDDAIVRTFCERLCRAIIKTDADTVISEKHDFDSTVSTYPISKDRRQDDVIEGRANIVKAHRVIPFVVDSFGVTVWGALYKRKVIEGIDWDFAEYTIAEDEFWTVQTKILSKKITYVYEQLYCYRINTSSRSKIIKPIYYKKYSENREIPFIALGLEIYKKNSKLFQQHKINMPEEPLLYGIGITKGLLFRVFDAGELDASNIMLVKQVAKEFLHIIESGNFKIEKNEILELTFISADPEAFVQYVQLINQGREEVQRLRDENALLTNELEVLRRPGIKLASRKLAGALKRRAYRTVMPLIFVRR